VGAGDLFAVVFSEILVFHKFHFGIYTIDNNL